MEQENKYYIEEDEEIDNDEIKYGRIHNDAINNVFKRVQNA